MKAIVYNGPRDVQVQDMPDPKIEHPNDVIVQITTSAARTCNCDEPILKSQGEHPSLATPTLPPHQPEPDTPKPYSPPDTPDPQPPLMPPPVVPPVAPSPM